MKRPLISVMCDKNNDNFPNFPEEVETNFKNIKEAEEYIKINNFDEEHYFIWVDEEFEDEEE